MGQGNGCIMTTTPIRTYGDLAGKQIRCGASQVPILEAYGTKPTDMIFAEVFEAVRTGVVEGFYGMLTAAAAIKLYEVTKYVTLNPYYIGAYLMVMNKGVWDGLSPDQQAAIEKATSECFEEYLAAGRYNDAEEAKKLYEEKGMEIIEFDEASLKELGDATAKLQEEYAAKLDGDGFDGTGSLELLKSLAEEYNGAA
jgi:TRAP-type C4-dicarboxylate transport system substrate-binding protein